MQTRTMATAMTAAGANKWATRWLVFTKHHQHATIQDANTRIRRNVEYLKNGSASSKHTDGESTPKVVGEHRRSHSVIQSFGHWGLPSFLPSFLRSFVRSFVRSFIFSCMHTYIYDIQYKFICMYHIISC